MKDITPLIKSCILKLVDEENFWKDHTLVFYLGHIVLDKNIDIDDYISKVKLSLREFWGNLKKNDNYIHSETEVITGILALALSEKLNEEYPANAQSIINKRLSMFIKSKDFSIFTSTKMIFLLSIGCKYIESSIKTEIKSFLESGLKRENLNVIAFSLMLKAWINFGFNRYTETYIKRFLSISSYEKSISDIIYILWIINDLAEKENYSNKVRDAIKEKRREIGEKLLSFSWSLQNFLQSVPIEITEEETKVSFQLPSPFELIILYDSLAGENYIILSQKEIEEEKKKATKDQKISVYKWQTMFIVLFIGIITFLPNLKFNFFIPSFTLFFGSFILLVIRFKHMQNKIKQIKKWYDSSRFLKLITAIFLFLVTWWFLNLIFIIPKVNSIISSQIVKINLPLSLQTLTTILSILPLLFSDFREWIYEMLFEK